MKWNRREPQLSSFVVGDKVVLRNSTTAAWRDAEGIYVGEENGMADVKLTSRVVTRYMTYPVGYVARLSAHRLTLVEAVDKVKNLREAVAALRADGVEVECRIVEKKETVL